ncbi:MAG: hypothetical protein NTV22_04685 [bacterium]|nr:hypothetical protein [bacterium]
MNDDRCWLCPTCSASATENRKLKTENFCPVCHALRAGHAAAGAAAAPSFHPSNLPSFQFPQRYYPQITPMPQIAQRAHKFVCSKQIYCLNRQYS